MGHSFCYAPYFLGIKMRKILIVFLFLILPSLAFAGGAYEVNVYELESQSGSTMAGTSTGVSLIGTIDLSKMKPANGVFSIEPGTWKFAAGQASGTGEQTTGSSADSAVTVTYCYGISNKELTTAEWETRSGITEIESWTISGNSNEPKEFFPEFAVYIGIFARCSGISKFLVPEDTVIAVQ
jgi:hypothetical protein